MSAGSIAIPVSCVAISTKFAELQTQMGSFPDTIPLERLSEARKLLGKSVHIIDFCKTNAFRGTPEEQATMRKALFQFQGVSISFHQRCWGAEATQSTLTLQSLKTSLPDAPDSWTKGQVIYALKNAMRIVSDLRMGPSLQTEENKTREVLLIAGINGLFLKAHPRIPTLVAEGCSLVV